MNDTSSATWELAMVLPLGVIANQLARIEADLRFLNIKAATLASQGSDARVMASVEKINETLALMQGLTVDLQAQLQPSPAPGRIPQGKDRESRKPPLQSED